MLPGFLFFVLLFAKDMLKPLFLIAKLLVFAVHDFRIVK